jgi:hypothetical protein
MPKPIKKGESRKRYRRGASFEYRVIDRMEQYGWYCIRSAGSHGFADVVCLKDGNILLLQMKKGEQITPDRKNKFAEQYAQYRGYKFVDIDLLGLGWADDVKKYK